MTILAPKITPFLNIPYPDEESDPFWDAFEGMVENFEQVVFYNKMFANMIVTNGGIRSWNPTSRLFSWTDDFQILVPHWGFRVRVVNGPDGMTRAAGLQDGQCLIIKMPMQMSGDITTNFTLVSQLNVQEHNNFVVAACAGSALYIKNIGELA